MAMNDADNRALFAHELTHVYQDQSLTSPGTLAATRAQFKHWWAGGPDPYDYTLTADTNWSDLEPEQQAEVVQRYQKHRDGIRLKGDQLRFHEQVLEQAGLFQWK